MRSKFIGMPFSCLIYADDIRIPAKGRKRMAMHKRKTPASICLAYYSVLPQLIVLLLKNCSLLRGIRYALFKR
jgi:hypothetical protein